MSNDNLASSSIGVYVTLTQGYVALIDREDIAQANHKWHACASGGGRRLVYAQRRKNGKNLKLHREILGTTDASQLVDHRDGDTLNCRRSNLRIATKGGNRANAAKQRGGQSRFKGAVAAGPKWRAFIKLHQKTIYLGQFGSEVDAAQAYNLAADELFGEFARFNTVLIADPMGVA